MPGCAIRARSLLLLAPSLLATTGRPALVQAVTGDPCAEDGKVGMCTMKCVPPQIPCCYYKSQACLQSWLHNTDSATVRRRVQRAQFASLRACAPHSCAAAAIRCMREHACCRLTLAARVADYFHVKNSFPVCCPRATQEFVPHACTLGGQAGGCAGASVATAKVPVDACLRARLNCGARRPAANQAPSTGADAGGLAGGSPMVAERSRLEAALKRERCKPCWATSVLATSSHPTRWQTRKLAFEHNADCFNDSI
jgi:hypothetical protein